MHKKFSKGIAAVMSAALVLGSVVTGVVPANAATSVQAEDGLYETTYNMSELEIEGNKSWGRPSNTEVQGTSVSLTFSGSWTAEFFTIPAEVRDAGLKGAKITYTEPNANIGIKLGGDHEFGWDILVAEGQTEITTIPDKIATVPNGTPVPDGTRFENWEGDRTPEHIQYITAIGIVQTGSDGCTVVAESITFLTENPVGDVETPEKPVENTVKYALTDLEYLREYGNSTVEGTTISFPEQYGQVCYAIPEKVLNAGLIACEVVSSADNDKTYTVRFLDANDTEICRQYHNSKVTIDYLVDGKTEADLKDITVLNIMRQIDEELVLTVDSVIFTTTNPVDGASDPGTTDPGTTDPGTEDPGTTDPTPAKLDKAKITSATAAKKKVTLKWDNVDNSTAYKVYRATSKKGTYKLVKTVKKTTYTDKKLKAGTKYFYKVQAVNKDTGAKGAKSAAKQVTTKK